jgi:integrase
VRGKVKHHPALPWQRIGEFMTELRKKTGMGARALEFAILTAARSSEVRGAVWDEIDLKAKLWIVPEVRIKGGKVHRVPLSAPVVKLLESLPRFQDSNYIFPAAKGGRLSDMTLSKAIKDMHEASVANGGEGYLDPVQNAIATPHGTARSTFKDWARSCTRFEDEVSELALAHVNSDATRSAYARDELLPKREKMMRDWAAFCTVVRSKSDSKVVPIGR